MTGICFQHITDEMRIGEEYNDIKKAIEEMYEKTKEKLYVMKYVYDIDYLLGIPYFIDWNTQAKNDGSYEIEGPRNQYRYDIKIRKHKNNRKISRNKIYEEMNKIYCTPYKKI